MSYRLLVDENVEYRIVQKVDDDGRCIPAVNGEVFVPCTAVYKWSTLSVDSTRSETERT